MHWDDIGNIISRRYC